MVSGGIFGPKLSGKTTLAIKLSEQYWLQQKRRSLVFDPHLETWGQQALVMTDEKEFWPIVWKSQGCLVIVEEAAATIRRERELLPVFTRLRHNHHLLLVVGHSGMDLLPTMRQQLDTLYLFRQPEEACKIWAMTFTQRELFEAANLGQYEFLATSMYSKPRKVKLAI